ncbi:hypothetical protein C7R88_17875 (plasmid) [Plesiomonas shigelloides]|nr:hypothetical protein C7R88_17875 [Plesiomonas shigelloides]
MTLEGHRREILVLARTGYVVLRIEPAPLACLAPLRVATGLPACHFQKTTARNIRSRLHWWIAARCTGPSCSP